MDSSDDSNNNFFKHVFNFDDDSKSDILNIIQYAILAIIPVVILNKSIGKYVPEADDKKGSLELSAEIVIQIIVTFIGLLLIHRMITFVPTYSNTKYVDFSVMYNILAVLMITMSLQTKLGEKVSILVDRLMELWNGPSDKKKKNGAVKVSQPISGQQILQQQAPPPPMYTDGTAISSLPTSESQPDSTQQMPNYNNMYRQDTTPLVGAATPSMSEGFGGPVAASEFLGGSGFGSAW
jgi:hypothetical protein